MYIEIIADTPSARADFRQRTGNCTDASPSDMSISWRQG
jgi:hypothetical protein